MSTDMKHIDPFSMPIDERPATVKAHAPLSADYDFDLHDNYDLISQPYEEHAYSSNKDVGNESR